MNETSQDTKTATPPKGVQELNPEREARSKEIFFAEWSQEHLNLVKRACCPPNIPTDEFAMFWAQCRRSELDPLKGEADCVPRNVKVKKTKIGPGGGSLEYEEYVTKWCFQPREIGLAARADRFPDFEGVISAAVYEKDTIEIDSSGLTVKHTFNPVGDRGPIKGAYAQVFRRGRRVPIVWLLFKDYAKDAKASPLWGSIPGTMIEKCARMAAWRRAYPNSFGDCYSGEEMEAMVAPAMLSATTGLHQTVDAPGAAPVAVSRTQQVKDQVAQRAAATRAQPPPSSDTVDTTAKVEPPGSDVADASTMGFGPEKGKPLAELTDEQLQSNLAKAEDWLKANEGKQRGPNSALMERSALMLKLELAVRTKRVQEAALGPSAAPTTPAITPPEPPLEREPGDDQGEAPLD